MRALLILLALAPVMALDAARAQSAGGIQVAPVMITMSEARNMVSLRVRNGRDRPVAFEVDVYDWRQENGRDVLTPSGDLLIAPGVFEAPAGAEQVVRLGALPESVRNERAFRVILRELPAQREGRTALGFSLELSLPVFVTPRDAQSRLEARADAAVLTLSNQGRAHIRLSSVATEAGAVQAPRYLLAGSSVEIALPQDARTVRLVCADIDGPETERIVHVGPAVRPAALP